MAFSQVVAAVEAQLVAIQAWVTTIKIGDEFVEETGQAPRLVVIPTDDAYGPPIGPGGNPRPLANVTTNAIAVIWGTDRDTTEGLRDQFVIALHRALKATSTSAHARGGTYKLGKGAWTRGTNLSRAGFEYRLAFSVEIPILDRAWASTPNAAPSTGTYTGDQANSYPTVGAPLDMVADVAATLGSPPSAQGNQTVTVPKP